MSSRLCVSVSTCAFVWCVCIYVYTHMLVFEWKIPETHCTHQPVSEGVQACGVSTFSKVCL